MRARQDENGNYDPIERLIEEALSALNQRMYSVSLMATLALVDICGALQSESGRAKGERFEAWFSANVPEAFSRLDAADAYQLRCGLLHQGRTCGKSYNAIVFTLPDRSGTIVHSNEYIGAKGASDRVLDINLRMFVVELLKAVGVWWVMNKAREPVAMNALKLARVRPNGLPPYIEGLPVIA